MDRKELMRRAAAALREKLDNGVPPGDIFWSCFTECEAEEVREIAAAMKPLTEAELFDAYVRIRFMNEAAISTNTLRLLIRLSLTVLSKSLCNCEDNERPPKDPMWHHL